MKRKIIVNNCSDCPYSQNWINVQSIPRFGKYFYTCKEMLGEENEYTEVNGTYIPEWCPLEIEK